MKLIHDLKARFPKLVPSLIALAAVSSLGGYAAYQRLSDDCCQPGAACCHPGAACCLRHKASQ